METTSGPVRKRAEAASRLACRTAAAGRGRHCRRHDGCGRSRGRGSSLSSAQASSPAATLIDFSDRVHLRSVRIDRCSRPRLGRQRGRILEPDRLVASLALGRRGGLAHLAALIVNSARTRSARRPIDPGPVVGPVGRPVIHRLVTRRATRPDHVCLLTIVRGLSHPSRRATPLSFSYRSTSLWSGCCSGGGVGRIWP
jgi:hypothetical protein